MSSYVLLGVSNYLCSCTLSSARIPQSLKKHRWYAHRKAMLENIDINSRDRRNGDFLVGEDGSDKVFDAISQKFWLSL